MLSSILLAVAGQVPPRFIGAPVSLAPSLTERFEVIGFAGGDRLTLFQKGGASLLGETVDVREYKVFSVPEKDEVIVDPKMGAFVSERDSSVILSQGLRGPSGRILRGVRGSGRFYVGSEPVPVGSGESRAVLDADDKAFYLDDLLDNKEALSVASGMVNGFQEALDISSTGMVAAHALVKNGSSAKRAFILKPVVEGG